MFAFFAAYVNAAEEAQSAAPPTNVAPAAISVSVTSTAIAPAVAVTNSETVRVIQMPKLSLPPTLDQVVKLSQSGADESVIRAYVEKAAPPYRITGNEIVQLRDLGISQGVIMSLIEHSQSAEVAGTTEIIGPQNPQSPPEPQQGQTNVAEAPLSEDVAPFYDTLSPYGGWYDVPGYGWSWQPSVVVVNPGWRPYCDSGYWLWSDYGWYWNSYYSWGWAPFHYGRWYCHASRGWFWCPDRTWGAAWVSWRDSGRHCGWAALPPGAHFRNGHWNFRGARVGADFDFGIRSDHFNFVEHGRFTDRQVGRHTVAARDGQSVFERSTVANNYVAGANNRIINQGVSRDRIAAASQTPVRSVSVQELPRGASATMPDRVNRMGNTEVVYRPGSQISVPRTTTASVAANRSVGPTTRASSLQSNPGFNQRAQTQSRPAISGNGAGRQVFPNTGANSPNRGAVVQPRQNGNVLSTPQRALPSAGQNRVYARPSAPAYAPRATGPAANVQRFSAPSGRMSAPSGGGQSRGSVSHGGGGGGGGSASRGSSSGGQSHGLRR
jgi:hypothetical protein